MKKITFILISILCAIHLMAQTPEAFKYQAVARTSAGVVMNEQNISVQISIFESGSAIYTEEHALTTTSAGLFTLNIGDGISSLGDFTTIDWSTGTYSVETALDENAGSNYTLMGTSPLLTVPYAMHAKTAENVFSGDYQDLANAPDMSDYDTNVNDDFSGQYSDLQGAPAIPANTSDLTNDSGFITSADDADADASNELQDLSLTGSTLSIANGNSVDLSGIDTDTQLSEGEVDAYVANNGYITNADDADADASNELQDLSLTGTTLSIANGNSVDLSSVDTDTQLSEGEVDAYVANNGYITSADDADADASNELQDLSLTGSTLSIANGNSVDLSGINTDTQLTEAQVDAYVADNGYITSANDADADASNELQDLSLSGTTLSIENGNSVNLSTIQDGFEANTDEQTLSTSENDLTISDGNTISLPYGKFTRKYIDGTVANNVGTTEVMIRDVGTFVKKYDNSLLEITFQGEVSLDNASANAYIEFRVDDADPGYGRQSYVHFSSHGTSKQRIVFTDFVSGVSAGQHTITLWGKMTSGTDDIKINAGGYSGTNVIIREYFSDTSF